MTDTDIQIQPTGTFRIPTGKIVPIYLVVFNTDDKTRARMIATKFDNEGNYVKFVGFFTNESVKKIEEDYQNIIKNADKLIYKEVMVSMTNVSIVQNLIFRQK